MNFDKVNIMKDNNKLYVTSERGKLGKERDNEKMQPVNRFSPEESSGEAAESLLARCVP
jgi:hypothetical protein